jgi:hypothetical protein
MNLRGCKTCRFERTLELQLDTLSARVILDCRLALDCRFALDCRLALDCWLTLNCRLVLYFVSSTSAPASTPASSPVSVSSKFS